MAICLYQVLHFLVSDNQLALIKGRNIIDNIMLASKRAYSINKKTLGGNLILSWTCKKVLFCLLAFPPTGSSLLWV